MINKVLFLTIMWCGVNIVFGALLYGAFIIKDEFSAMMTGVYVAIMAIMSYNNTKKEISELERELRKAVPIYFDLIYDMIVLCIFAITNNLFVFGLYLYQVYVMIGRYKRM